jgi:Cu2+-containing amine oxidase
VVSTEQQAAQKFGPSTVRLLTNFSKENKVGNPVSYQLIPYAGGTHPVAKGANFGKDEWLYHRLSFMDKQLWVTRYNPEEKYPEGKYPNRSDKDSGLGQFTGQPLHRKHRRCRVADHRHHPHRPRRKVADHADRMGARAAQAVELLR